MYPLEELLSEMPVIAAIRNEADLRKVLTSNVKVVFILYGSLMTIPDICQQLKKAEKTIFIHLDMIDGLKLDIKGLEFIKMYANPYGIITTKASTVRSALTLGFCVIQRVFILDSQSLQTGISNIHSAVPHAVEVLPGIAAKIIHTMQQETKLPIIAGGLINTKKEVIDAISSGAVAVSTSNEEIWNLM